MTHTLPAHVSHDLTELARLRTCAQLDHDELVPQRARREAALRAALWSGCAEDINAQRMKLARGDADTTWYWLTAAHYDRHFREGTMLRVQHRTGIDQMHEAMARHDVSMFGRLEDGQNRKAFRLRGILSDAVEHAPRRRDLEISFAPVDSTPRKPTSTSTSVFVLLLLIWGLLFSPLPWILLMLLMFSPVLFVVALCLSMWAFFGIVGWLKAKSPESRPGSSYPWDEKFHAAR